MKSLGRFVVLIIAAAMVGSFVGFILTGCRHNPGPQPQLPGWDGAAVDYSPPDGPATCLDVCRNGEHLGCSWAAPTPNGASCVDVCANAQNGPAPFDLDCRARATSCTAIDGTCN